MGARTALEGSPPDPGMKRMSNNLAQADEIEVLLHHSSSTNFSALSDLSGLEAACARTYFLWTGCVCIGTG